MKIAFLYFMFTSLQFIPTKILIKLIAGYQKSISPLLGSRCRFYPSCSRYTVTALTQFGFWRGLWLGFWRIARCHPGCAGGIEEVPQQFSWQIPFLKNKAPYE